MGFFDRWVDTEQRRRFRGTGIALALVIAALVIPPGDAAQTWIKTQMIWLSAFFLAFQVGQLWQAMRMARARDMDRLGGSSTHASIHASLPASAPESPSRGRASSGQPRSDVPGVCSGNGATMSATASASIAVHEKLQAQEKPAGMGKMAHQNRAYLIGEDQIEIRAYANLEEATRHGWVFGETIAIFSGQPVPATATLAGKTYAYSGLGPNRNTGMVAPDTRLFGPLSYRLQAPLPA